MEEHVKEVSELLKVIANENRLMILCLLSAGPMTVSKILQGVKNISQSAVSQHLAALKAYKLLDSVKEGQNVTYFINDKRILKVMEVLKDNYCE